MSSLLAVSRRLALAVAAVALAAGLTAGSARADIAYAYAEESIGPLTATANSVPGSSVTVTGVSPQSATSANLNNTAVAHSTAGNPNGFDAPQSLVGPGPGENSFVKFAFPGNPTNLVAGTLPASTVAPFSRGDVVLSGTTGSAVAESYVKGLDQTAAANGHNSVQYSITVSDTGTYNINFGYANDRYAATNTPPGVDTASSKVAFEVTVSDALGTTLLDVKPDVTQGATGIAQPNKDEVATSGTTFVDTPSLTAGQTYYVNFQLNAETIVGTAVPEPATMAMALTALPLLGLGLLRRRSRRARA